MEKVLQGARDRCDAEPYVNIQCPMNVDTHRVCRDGITKKFDPLAHQSISSLERHMQLSMAQHLNTVHDKDWVEAQNMSYEAQMTTWADNGNEVESRPRSKSPSPSHARSMSPLPSRARSRSPPPIGARSRRGRTVRATLEYMQVDALPSVVLESIRAAVDRELQRRLRVGPA